MLKSLVVLSLLAIASASTTHALSEIVGFTGAVTVTATYPDAGTPPTLSAITYTTTYDSSLATLLPFTVSAGTAASTGNNTVQGGFLTLTNGGDTVTVPFVAIPTGTNTYSLISGNNYLKFLNTGNYAVSVSLTTAILGTYAVTLSAAFPTVAVTKYTPPVLTAVSYLSPQTGGCDASSCTGSLSGNVSATSRPSSYWTTYLRSTHASTGVIFSSSATFNSGTAHLDTDTLAGLVVNVGGLVNGVWKSSASGTTAETHVPQNDNLVISGQFLEQTGRNTYFNEAAVGAFQSSVKLTSGSTDVTAPTCTVLTTTPATITTIASSVDVTATLTCADETGGSGLWINGLFITATITNGNAGTQSFPTPVSGFATFPVPPYISGTLNVVGAFAVDNAGNAALYGSCGGAVGYDSLGCAGGGSGSSSASTVAFSLFSILLVVLSLFA